MKETFLINSLKLFFMKQKKRNQPRKKSDNIKETKKIKKPRKE